MIGLGRGRARVILRILGPLAAALAGLVAVSVGAYAAFTDTAGAASGTFTAGTAIAPTAVKCTAGAVGTGGISWTAPSGPTPGGYLVTYKNTSTNAVATVTVTTSPWKPTSTQLAANNVTYAVTVQSTYGTAWLSTSTTVVNIRRATNNLTCP